MRWPVASCLIWAYTVGTDLDDMACYKLAHLDLVYVHCLHRCLFWSAGMKGFHKTIKKWIIFKTIVFIIANFFHENILGGTHWSHLFKTIPQNIHDIHLCRKKKKGKYFLISLI